LDAFIKSKEKSIRLLWAKNLASRSIIANRLTLLDWLSSS
jgi:hypothetical protein